MMGGGTGAYALHWSGGAARCVRSHIPGALSILKGAVPDRARGLGHMAPTYFRREPGIDALTAIAAPHFAFSPSVRWITTPQPFQLPKPPSAGKRSPAAMACRPTCVPPP